MQEELVVERMANDAYELFRAKGRDKRGRGLGAPPKPFQPPQEPAGKINVTDPDSRNVKTTRGWVQGYNAQAVVNENHIVLAAEVTIDSPDFGHLEPMIVAAERELEAIGVTDHPQVALADAGYWHQLQMQNIAARGTQVLVPPDASKRADARPGWNAGMYAFMRRVLASELGGQRLPKAPGARRARVRRPEVQPQGRPLPATRTLGRQLRVAITQCHPQPPQAPPPPDSSRRGLKARRSPGDTASRSPTRPRSTSALRASNLSDSHRGKQVSAGLRTEVPPSRPCVFQPSGGSPSVLLCPERAIPVGPHARPPSDERAGS